MEHLAFSRIQARGGGQRTEGEEGQQAVDRGTLTTGLARAELALEEARELELRWPQGSEGCPTARRAARRQRQRDRVSRDVPSTQASTPQGSIS